MTYILLYIILPLLVISFVITMIVSRYFSKKGMQKMQESNEAQRQFVSNVSHELRTPLAALIAELNLSISRERTIEEYKQAIKRSIEDAKRMQHLINDLLDLAKAEYKADQIAMENVRIDELLLDCCAYVKKNNPEYDVELGFSNTFWGIMTSYEDEDDDFVEESLISLKANAYLLSIAFTNLIENNCKYSLNHRSIIQISTKDNRLLILFSDNGRGMSKADLENLFKPFVRGESSGGTEGHGIGMALAKRIIELHSGNLVVTSSEGKGTTFSVQL